MARPLISTAFVAFTALSAMIGPSRANPADGVEDELVNRELILNGVTRLGLGFAALSSAIIVMSVGPVIAPVGAVAVVSSILTATSLAATFAAVGAGSAQLVAGIISKRTLNPAETERAIQGAIALASPLGKAAGVYFSAGGASKNDTIATAVFADAVQEVIVSYHNLNKVGISALERGLLLEDRVAAMWSLTSKTNGAVSLSSSVSDIMRSRRKAGKIEKKPGGMLPSPVHDGYPHDYSSIRYETQRKVLFVKLLEIQAIAENEEWTKKIQAEEKANLERAKKYMDATDYNIHGNGSAMDDPNRPSGTEIYTPKTPDDGGGSTSGTSVDCHYPTCLYTEIDR